MAKRSTPYVASLAPLLCSCAVALSFDDYDLASHPTTAFYQVGGSVDGVPAGAAVLLALNGASPLRVSNGPFTFSDALPDGATYNIELKEQAAGRTCTLERGTGKISGAAITDVAVHCASNDTSLHDVAFSGGPLTQADEGAVLTARIKTSDDYWQQVSATLTAAATDPEAQIRLVGSPSVRGSINTPIVVKQGPNFFDLEVTARDGVTKGTTHVNIVGYPNDYLKASNTGGFNAQFGYSVALSDDGNTLAVGAKGERSGSTGINGNQSDASAENAGAVYLFVRTTSGWQQQAYMKASDAKRSASFGYAVALSSDGNTLAVRADLPDSSGAVYLFTRTASRWTEQAILRAPSPKSGDYFGYSIALSADGNLVAVGSLRDGNIGAAYVFARSGTLWAEQARVQASTPASLMYFGSAVALARDGSTLAVGATNESSNATGVGGNETNTSAPSSGAAYVFTRSGTTWTQQAYVKASNTHQGDLFGTSLGLSTNGNRLIVGAPYESSSATGVGGDQTATAAGIDSGAVYIFSRTGASWAQESYVKASNARKLAFFGISAAFAADGEMLAVGAFEEDGGAIGVNGDPSAVKNAISGAAYVFSHAGGQWAERAYVKPSNTRILSREYLHFGRSVALSHDGKTLAVGGEGDESKATGVNGDQSDDSIDSAGAVYVF
jgi:hypothetical protein